MYQEEDADDYGGGGGGGQFIHHLTLKPLFNCLITMNFSVQRRDGRDEPGRGASAGAKAAEIRRIGQHL